MSAGFDERRVRAALRGPLGKVVLAIAQSPRIASRDRAWLARTPIIEVRP